MTAQVYASRSNLVGWAKLSLPIAYFLGLIVWEISAADLADVPALALGLLNIAYLSIIVSCYLCRGPGQALSRGAALEQIVGVLGANLLIPLSMLPAIASETPAILASFAGLALSLWSVWHLGQSFSLVPEARRLVQSGPYRYVRHPLYLAGFVIAVGLLSARLSPAAIGLFIAFCCTQALRISYEEDLLSDAFPEYAGYRESTGALLPRWRKLWNSWSSSLSSPWR